jgi:hypothetical protein
LLTFSFAVAVLEMLLNGPLADLEADGDIALGHACRQEWQHLCLADGRSKRHQLLQPGNPGTGARRCLAIEQLDGTYSFTAAVEVGQQTLTSTAEVIVACPQR